MLFRSRVAGRLDLVDDVLLELVRLEINSSVTVSSRHDETAVVSNVGALSVVLAYPVGCVVGFVLLVLVDLSNPRVVEILSNGVLSG